MEARDDVKSLGELYSYLPDCAIPNQRPLIDVRIYEYDDLHLRLGYASDQRVRNELMYHRYVALGDSQTEGLGDGDEVTGYRGWADRLAEMLAELNPKKNSLSLRLL